MDILEDYDQDQEDSESLEEIKDQPTNNFHLRKTFKVEDTIENIYTGGVILRSKDEKILLCSCENKIKFFNLDSSKIETVLAADSERVISFALSKSEDYLASSSENFQIHLFDLKTKTIKKSWKNGDYVTLTLDFDPTNTLLACGSSDKTIKIYDFEKGFCTHNFRGHKGIVTLVKFHPDPQRLQLFSASDDCTVKMWNLIDKTTCITFSEHFSTVTSFAFSKSGLNFITGSRDKIAIVWDLQTNKKKKGIPIYEPVESVMLVPPSACTFISQEKKIETSEILITAGEKGILKFWDYESGECIFEQTSKDLNYSILHLLFFPNSKRLVSVTHDQNIIIYNNQSFEIEKFIAGYNDEVIDIKYIGDENRIAVATNSEIVRIFHTKNHACDFLSGHTDIVLCLDVSPLRKNMLITGSKDSSIRIWDCVSKECLAVCTGHTEAIGAVAFARTTLSFFVSGSKDKTIKIWDIKDAKIFQVKPRYTQKAHEKDINTLAVSPNDKLFASGSQDKTIKLWDTNDLSLITILKGHKRGVWSLEFSKVDKILASSSGDKTIKLWSITDYTCLKTFEGHTNSVLRVLFITSGMQLISSGSDGLIKLWTIKTGECVNTFANHTEKVWSLAVHSDGNEITSGGADSLINIWKDYTQIEEEEQKKLQEERILIEQELLNSIQRKDFKKAIALAFTLDQPFRLYNLFEQLLETNQQGTVKELISQFSDEEIQKSLNFIKDWNTNSKHSIVSQLILNTILKCFPPSRLEILPSMKKTLEGLIPYTERHFLRLDKYLQKSFLLDYTLQKMKKLQSFEPEEQDMNQKLEGKEKPEIKQDMKIEKSEEIELQNNFKQKNSQQAKDDEEAIIQNGNSIYEGEEEETTIQHGDNIYKENEEETTIQHGEEEDEEDREIKGRRAKSGQSKPKKRKVATFEQCSKKSPTNKKKKRKMKQ